MIGFVLVGVCFGIVFMLSKTQAEIPPPPPSVIAGLLVGLVFVWLAFKIGRRVGHRDTGKLLPSLLLRL